MPGADIFTGVLAAFQYMLVPHTVYQIFPATIIAAAIAMKLSELRKSKADTYTIVLRVFGTLIISLTVIAGIQSLTNMAYTGEPASVIPATVIFIMAATVSVAVESKVRDLSYRMQQNKHANSDDIWVFSYLIPLLATSTIGFIIISTGLTFAALILKHTWTLVIKSAEMIGIALYTIAFLISLPAGWTLLKKKKRIHKVLGATILTLLTSPLILKILNWYSNTFVAILGPILLLAGIYAGKTWVLNKEAYSKYLRDIGITTFIFATLAALPAIYIIYNPNSFNVDCSVNFQKIGTHIFAYGPQEIILYPPKDEKPFVILPWKEYYIDLNVFCDAKFEIITSLGPISCNPTDKICEKSPT